MKFEAISDDNFIYGPGDIKNCHKLEEYVSRKEFILAFEILKDYLFNF